MTNINLVITPPEQRNVTVGLALPGPKGDKGDPGVKGDKGDPGASAWSEITDKPFNTIDRNTLVNRSGTLCVNTTDDAEQDNTRPITSSGVHVICGNINALLQAI